MRGLKRGERERGEKGEERRIKAATGQVVRQSDSQSILQNGEKRDFYGSIPNPLSRCAILCARVQI